MSQGIPVFKIQQSKHSQSLIYSVVLKFPNLWEKTKYTIWINHVLEMDLIGLLLFKWNWESYFIPAC